MNKILTIILIITVYFFISCEKQKKSIHLESESNIPVIINELQTPPIETNIQTENYVEIPDLERNINNELIVKYTLIEIIEYINNFLNINEMVRLRDNNTFKNWISLLNVNEPYNITKKDTVINRHTGDNDYFYTIEYDFIKLSVYEAVGIPRYLISSFSITLNKENFLELFPYRNIEEFLTDDNFGNIADYDSNSIMYTPNIYSAEEWTLIFENGFIYQIKYWERLN
ncbi:MAG: hypothetical protein LBI28_09955 [Treponema sp.]|jgi:hypothetical protein|nr:hypothetical protein [Treponema sp.]